jgi:predicted DNA-binding transcriptional regulator YafY
VPAARVGPALREAAAKGHAVWMSYVNREGVSSERIIEPITVSGNLIEAYDHLRSEVRTFLLERILSIVPLDAGAAEILGGEL